MLTYIDWFGVLWLSDSWHEYIEIRLTDEQEAFYSALRCDLSPEESDVNHEMVCMDVTANGYLETGIQAPR